jgi:TolA-binding protein|tara:strand:+ start:1370 stop:1579 length:210 start_codon:yes stop_codon:yes gene_type:complete
MDTFTISTVQKLIKNILDRCKQHAIYGVDSMEQLQYVRGQIKSLEDLQQELKDLLNNQEIEDTDVDRED